MKRRLLVLTTTTSLALLAGCGGGHSNNPTPPDGGGTTPPTTVSFTAFVHTQLAATSETTQPADVNGVDFTFPDDNNPAAFDDVVGGP